ncbi:hypothetical protein HPP92_011785 [Vanilla planifolia]|uniref:FRIGIDA-like protein n=1 Tax=Vanilla planifolia TaxID=51239 RepID=A0A835V5C7_VANPL|nr:hypothetical protein HPP92_011785 [Vanilla planifolia]
MGMERLLVTRIVKERAREMADAWKELMEQRGGLENAKAQDVHAFLQHLVTFGIGVKEDKKLYRKMVVSFSWRKQMPKLAISLGLEDEMTEIIDELISKGQPLDAIHFAYESGLHEKYPPVPLLKAYLRDAKKTAALIPEDGNNSCQSANNSFRKEQSAIRAVMKCIEEHKLEPEFPLENLNKRLENLEKAKIEKRKTSVGPANKRTRANNCVLMPPAKAGRLTNNACVSSFPAASALTYAKTPPSHATYQTSPFPPYPYERSSGHGFYAAHPMNYPPYGAYSNGMGAYNNGMPPAYQQQAYYR